MGVVRPFGRNVRTFRYGGSDERVSGSGSGNASGVGVVRPFGRNVRTFRYGGFGLPRRVPIIRTGFVEAHVQMQRSVSRPVPERSEAFNAFHIQGHRIGPEDPGLLDGLRGPAATEIHRTIGSDPHERNAAVIGFDRRGQELGHGSAGSGEDGDGLARSLAEAEGEEGGGSLVEMMPDTQIQILTSFQKRTNERNIAGSGADDEVHHPESGKAAKNGSGEGGVGGHGKREMS